MKNTYVNVASAYTIPSLEESRLFEELMDIAERLHQAWYDEEAYELEEQLLDNNIRHVKAITKKFQSLFDNLEVEINILQDHQSTLINEDESLISNIQGKIDLQERISKIKDIQNPQQYKDILKYDTPYFFRDNVLDRRMISATQWYGMSNLPKDFFKDQKSIPQRYKKQIQTRFPKWERISRTPIQRYFTPIERLKLRNDNQVNIEIADIIDNTINRNLPSPSKEEVLTKDQIKNERWNDERRVKFYRNMYLAENEEIVDRYESYEREF